MGVQQLSSVPHGWQKSDSFRDPTATSPLAGTLPTVGDVAVVGSDSTKIARGTFSLAAAAPPEAAALLLNGTPVTSCGFSIFFDEAGDGASWVKEES